MEQHKKTVRGLKALPACLMAFLILPCTATVKAADSVKMNIHVTGHIVATGSCTFDTQGPLNIDFGTVNYSTLGKHPKRCAAPGTHNVHEMQWRLRRANHNGAGAYANG